jgi:hypothetical protein
VAGGFFIHPETLEPRGLRYRDDLAGALRRGDITIAEFVETVRFMAQQYREAGWWRPKSVIPDYTLGDE